MVKFVLDSKTDKKVIYKYYHEGDKKKKPGIISVVLDNMEFTIDEVAEDDRLRSVSAKELNELRDHINKMRVEMGELPLTEEELPTVTEDAEWYVYASHAIKKIKEEIEKGNIPNEGTVMWY